MKKRLFYFLGQDGFLRMNTSVPEFTIFFKKENGFVSTVILADLDENPYVTTNQVVSVRNKVKWKFMDQGMEEVHTMVLAISEAVDRAVLLKDENPFFWVIDSKQSELVIPTGST